MIDSKKYNVVAIGNAMLDVVCEVPDKFLSQEGISKGFMNLISRERSNNILKLVQPIIETAGGSAANTISTLAKLGLKTGYIGKIADDPKGKIFKKDMSDNSIIYRTRFLDKDNTESTGKCIVLITPDKERTMNTYLGATEFLTDLDVDEELIAKSEWLYLEGYRFDGKESKTAFFKALSIAKKYKTKISLTLSDSFCVDRHREDFLQLIEEIDLLFCNKNELMSLYKLENINKALGKASRHIKMMACTSDKLGAYLWDGFTMKLINTREIKEVDTTGAGDAFAAGFLYGMVSSFSLMNCTSFGNKIAGEILKIYGPRLESNIVDLLKND